MKQAYLSALILTAAIALLTLTSCEKEPQSTHRRMEGVHAITRESSQQYDGTRGNNMTDIFLYSDLFPLKTLINCFVKVHMVSNNQFFLANAANYTYSDTCSVAADDLFSVTKWSALTFPHCGGDGLALRLTHKIMDDGVYDFYLRFENPAREIYYQTPTYRYEIQPGREEWLYIANISILK